MDVATVISQITYENGIVTSKTTGRQYTVADFLDTLFKKEKFTKQQKEELREYFIDYLKEQSKGSIFMDKFLKKYNIEASDGVFILNGKITPTEELFRIFWRDERLLPSELSPILEDVEKISEKVDIQQKIFNERVVSRAKKGKSAYLASLDTIYKGSIQFRTLLHNIIVPNTKPLFHILYDDGVGGTGKSTLLDVLTMIVGQEYVSNVLLDNFSNRFMFANMLGKYLNIGDDNGKNDELQNVGVLKSIVTGGRVTIDRKMMQPIEVRLFAKQLFATNILPYIDFTDGGLMRRLNIVPMNVKIPYYVSLPEFDENEIGAIIYEILQSPDIEYNSNTLAMTSSSLYRFYKAQSEGKGAITYPLYCQYCYNYGFKAMNIVNYENKLKFIEAYEKEQKLYNELWGSQLDFISEE